jgi:large-conductance mechanosensitive channel
LPGLEFYGSVVNSAVCAAIIAAGFFIIAALINTINKKLKQPKQLDNKAV